MKLLIGRIMVLFTILFGISFPVLAYNVLHTNDDTGEPIAWDNAKPIKYWLDPGSLGVYTNEQLHILLQEAMRTWESVSSAKVPHFEFAGYLPEDINGSNYQNYVGLTRCFTDELDYCNVEGYRNLQTVIIFDEGGSILDNELCRIESCSAHAGPETFEGDPGVRGGVKSAVQGIAVFGAANMPDTMAGTFTHELGHLLGLGHSPINQQLFYGINPSEEIDDRVYFPTMEVSNRYITTASGSSYGATLNPDDIAAISMLYPADDFETTTGAISGTIYKSDGTPMEHINVVAREINDPMCNVYSVVSGRYCYPTSVLTTYCVFNNGDFIIEGLLPGSYTIEVEDIADEQNMNFTYHYLAGDAEFWNEGDVADEDPYLRTVITVEAGEVVEGVDITLNRSEVTDDRVKFIPIEEFDIPVTTSCVDSDIDYNELIGIVTDTPASSSGGCSLMQ